MSSYRDQADVIRIDVGVVLRRDSDRNLELSGQVGRPIEGFMVHNRVTCDLRLLAILFEPYLVVRCGRGK